ncbi:putative RNA-binding protein [Cladophialophora carrionii]|uniref:Putative RNA-binding protein n=1 Tax=Cladophialophora carrionii TaxID=86049 RepID=A0A1C1CBE3_9EURO|nr:putative RNA-binding protein [Cladophialophora carrionii]
MHASSNDARGGLQRRFTTDSSKMSVARPFGQQYPSVNSTAQAKNKQMFEDIQNAKRKAEEQLRLLEMQERSLQMGASTQDLDRISTHLNRISLNGPVSEPTTPPEYAESGFSNRFSRSSRLSTNSILSPPGLSKRMSQSSSQVTSPPANRLSGNGMFNQSQKPSAKSVPGSRRGSDEDEYYPEDLPTTRAAASLNRFSMPVNTGRNPRLSVSGTGGNSFGLANTTSFLFDEDEDKLNAIDLTSPIAKAFAQLEGDDTFPTLTSDGLKLSANSAALDLANSKTPDLDWTLGSRYRPAHQSMPHTDSSMYRPVLSNLNISSPPADRPADLTRRKSQRHSMGVTFEEASPLPSANLTVSRPTSLQTSYSTNDVPTVKKTLSLDTAPTPPKTQAEQQFHNHNVSLGRIPANAVNNRLSREVAGGSVKMDDRSMTSPASNLHASAAPFNAGLTSTSDSNNMMALASPTSAYAPPPFMYNMQTFNINQMNPQTAVTGALQTYPQGQGIYGMNNAYNGTPQRSGTGGRRNHGDDARFNNVPLESYRGNLYELCKDQHGCRYLQRKLEDGNDEHIQAIFVETCPHIIELMTDPFGNYLCQKLFEHCNEDQRTTLINTAAPALATIALNQHGTRALQKMIEFVHTPSQVDTIIQALSPRVVELVQDLNGNHVVQKCLTRLGAERSQFIYDAVGNYCVIVGTHRHGCCVLQRCIDHAQGFQRAQLIARITHCAFDLVQDPFGNYVVQYILDLDEAAFTKPLCENFFGRVAALSKQKFSSNVIEKCLRTADMETKRQMVEEMFMGNELEKMLRDSFANYVVQTAMEYVDPATKARLVDAIRPILPMIKQTPHGRRIASKILGNDTPPRPVPGPSDNILASFGGGRANNRRNVQIVGGGFNGLRTSDTFENNIAGNGNGYGVMDPTVNMYNANNYANDLGQNGYAGFMNGGNNVI